MREMDAAIAGLGKLTAELSGKDLAKALRSAIGKEGRRLKKTAARKLETSVKEGKAVSHAKDVGRTIQSKVNRDLSMRVSAQTKASRGGRGMYRNRRGLLKPAAYWLDQGTRRRKTRKGYRRGAVEGLHFMADTKREELGKSMAEIARAFDKAVRRIAKKSMNK